MRRFLALISISLIFCSCTSSKHRVSTITYFENDYKDIVMQIAYMPDGKVAHIDLDSGQNRYDFYYETPNRITISEDNKNTYFAIVNELGFVTSIYDRPDNSRDKLEITYLYDNKYLSDIQYTIGQDKSYDYRFLWKDGNLQQCKFRYQIFNNTGKNDIWERIVNISYSYEKSRNSQNFVFFHAFTGIDSRWEAITIVLQSAGLLGLQNKNLVREIKSEAIESDRKPIMDYTIITNVLNNDGTIQKQYLNNNDNEVIKYNYSSR